MNHKRYPTVSVLIPTLNAARVLEQCLVSVRQQAYPPSRLEIIIADGGSTDGTLRLAKKYQTKVFKNPYKTGEAGKAIALSRAKGEIVALIDSDNVLPTKNWLAKMVQPFADAEVVGSEPWAYTYRRRDGFIDRYCALTGVGDPLCLFLGNYDRQSLLTGKWTGLPMRQEDKKTWLKVTLEKGRVPTIGANGTMLRRRFLQAGSFAKNYLVDIDILAKAINQKPLKFAKVKIGIVHLYCGRNINNFIRKQKRRVKDYYYYQAIGVRQYPWQQQDFGGIIKFGLFCLTVVPLFYQAAKGFLKKADSAWFFHPLACWLTLVIYATGTIKGKIFKRQQMDRSRWKQ